MGCGASSRKQELPSESEDEYKALFQATVEAGRANGESEEQMVATLLRAVFGPGKGRALSPAEASFYEQMTQLSPPREYLRDLRARQEEEDGGDADVAAASGEGASGPTRGTSAASPASGADAEGHSSDEEILRLWRDGCPALQELWPADGDVTTWEGVTVRKDGAGRRVEKVELEGKLGDAASVPAELGGLGALEVLDLNGNQLTSVPAELGQLGALEKLWLNRNQLTSVPAELGQLGALEKLGLSNNQLTSVPAELGELGALEVLYLDKNQLTSVPAELVQLGALRELHLDGNQLTSVPAELRSEERRVGKECRSRWSPYH